VNRRADHRPKAHGLAGQIEMQLAPPAVDAARHLPWGGPAATPADLRTYSLETIEARPAKSAPGSPAAAGTPFRTKQVW